MNEILRRLGFADRIIRAEDLRPLRIKRIVAYLNEVMRRIKEITL